MGQVVLITSGKGGAGKTTFTANIGAALTRREKSVLLIDANFGLRNLDIVLGVADRVVFDIYDVASGGCGIDDAIIDHPRCENLYMIASTQDIGGRRVEKSRFAQVVSQVRGRFDFIVIDGAAGIGESFASACGDVDSAIIITTPNPCSIRDSEQVALKLEQLGIERIKMVINRVSHRTMKEAGSMNIDEIIDAVRIGILGIVPEDMRLCRDMDTGVLPFEDFYVKANTAFFNISRRMCGETVPVMKI